MLAPAPEALAHHDIETPQDSSAENAHPPGQIPRPKPRAARPLKSSQVDELAAGYESGKTMKDLAVMFGINRLTVSAHLRRTGVPLRRRGLGPERAIVMARLYEAGWYSGRLAERFG